MHLNQLSIGLAHVKFCEGFPSCQCCQQALYSWIGYLFNFDTWFTIIIKSRMVLSPFRTRTMCTAQSKCSTGSKMPSHTNRFNSCSTLALMTFWTGQARQNRGVTPSWMWIFASYPFNISNCSQNTFWWWCRRSCGRTTMHLVNSLPIQLDTLKSTMAKQAHALSLQHKQGQAGSLLYCTSSLSIPRTPNGFPE